jgi:hypothetical protein
MDAPVMSTYYLPLRADFQHKYRFNLILPLVCYVEGNEISKTPMITSSQKNSFVIYYDGYTCCLYPSDILSPKSSEKYILFI